MEDVGAKEESPLRSAERHWLGSVRLEAAAAAAAAEPLRLCGNDAFSDLVSVRATLKGFISRAEK